MLLKMIDCTDGTFYGYLEVKNTSAEEVQKKINDIKFQFYEDDFDDWQIDNLLSELPREWECQWIRTTRQITI